jgi:hypothetical protein
VSVCQIIIYLSTYLPACPCPPQPFSLAFSPTPSLSGWLTNQPRKRTNTLNTTWQKVGLVVSGGCFIGKAFARRYEKSSGKCHGCCGLTILGITVLKNPTFFWEDCQFLFVPNFLYTCCSQR